MTQEPLFPIAGPPSVRRRPAAGVTYTRVHLKTRTLCGDCVEAIHHLGQGVAPFPRSARWRRTAPGEETRELCEQHKDERVGHGR